MCLGENMHLDLAQLLYLIDEMPEYIRLLKELEKRRNVKVVVIDAAKPYLIAALYQRLHRPTMVITAYPENSKQLYEQLFVWCSSGQINLFPEPDAIYYERIASDNSTELERLQVLSSLANIPSDEIYL